VIESKNKQPKSQALIDAEERAKQFKTDEWLSYKKRVSRGKVRGARFEVRGAILHRVLTPSAQNLEPSP
jgi:hypothetical protein